MGLWSSWKSNFQGVAGFIAGSAVTLVKSGVIALASATFIALVVVATLIITAVIVVDYYYYASKSSEVVTPLEDFSSFTVAGEFSYHASIHLNNQHFCSGAFIGTYFILTVAQCVHTFVNNKIEKSKMKVYVGIREVPAYFQYGYAVDKITVHPKFNAKQLSHNIAVLKLTEKVNEVYYAQPIALPKWEMNLEKTIVLVSGFRSFNAPNVPTDMTKSNMTVIKYSICHSHFSKKIITTAKFCATPSSRWKPCQTSRGGPAANTDEILVGLFVMENPQGCDKDLPENFVNVSKFLDFIKDETN